MPPDHDAANPVPIHRFPDRPVRYRLKTVLHTPTVGADRMSRLTWFTLCAITWFTPSVVGVYQKVSSFKCVNTFVNVNPPYAEFSKNQGNLSLGTGFTHSDFFSTKSLT